MRCRPRCTQVRPDLQPGTVFAVSFGAQPQLRSKMLRVPAAGCITDANFGRLQKIGWTRASRTDKGKPVHAIHIDGLAPEHSCEARGKKSYSVHVVGSLT